MTVKLHRFDFGNLRDFRAPIVVSDMPEMMTEEPPPPPPPPTFSESELEAVRAQAKQEAFAEGFEAGIARAAEQAEALRQTVDTTILQLGNMLGALQQEYHQLLHSESASLSQLVLMIAQKVTGTMLEQDGAQTITSLVEQCLPAVLSKPKLTIEMHADAFQQTVDRIEVLLHTSSFEGELQFRMNPALGLHDTILDWGSGQAERNTAQLWQEIETLLGTMPLTLNLPTQAGLAPSAFVDQNGSDATQEPTPPTV